LKGYDIVKAFIMTPQVRLDQKSEWENIELISSKFFAFSFHNSFSLFAFSFAHVLIIILNLYKVHTQ